MSYNLTVFGEELLTSRGCPASQTRRAPADRRSSPVTSGSELADRRGSQGTNWSSASQASCRSMTQTSPEAPLTGACDTVCQLDHWFCFCVTPLQTRDEYFITWKLYDW
jgi:hypothetical protein